MSSTQDTQNWPPRRVIVLGASNVVRGISTLIQTVRQASEGPFDLLAAVGHGRGYLSPSWVLGRWLPSIVDCGLWKALDERPGSPTSVLITDVGNDLLYGANVDQIIRAVEICLQRLVPRCERITMTGIPRDSLQHLTPRRFQLLRRVLFPTSRLTWQDALAATEELNGRMMELASRLGIDFRQPVSAWYGFDPIHIRRVHYGRAWSEFLAKWQGKEGFSPVPGSWWLWFYLHVQRPQRRGLFGFVQHRVQPTCRLSDGTLVSLY